MNVLAIAAHPDDETLGCGGTLLKHRDAGDALFWLVATQAHEPQWSTSVVEQKHAEITRVAKAYGVVRRISLGFLAGRLDTVPRIELIAGLRNAVEEVRPAVVYVVHGGDIHSDHQAVFAAAMAALKSFRMAGLGVRRVLSYETISSTDAGPAGAGTAFLPNCFNDITPFLTRKLEILQLYATELQPSPLPRSPESVQALARARGATIGVDAAEALMVIREIL